MEGYIFTRVNDAEYRAKLPGSLLNAARKESVTVPTDEGPGKCVNLRNTSWLNATVGREMGLVGSIENEKFDAHAVYIVTYCPLARPPYLFALKMP